MATEDIQLNERFDLIILSNIIGYVENILLLLKQLHKICRERTKIIVTYHNYLWESILKLGEFLGLKTKTLNQNFKLIG